MTPAAVLAVDATSSSGLFVLGASLIGAAGSVIGSMLLARHSPGEPKRLLRRPKRVTHGDRLHRIEQWKEQKADPLLDRIENVLDWKPEEGEDDPSARRPSRRRKTS